MCVTLSAARDKSSIFAVAASNDSGDVLFLSELRMNSKSSARAAIVDTVEAVKKRKYISIDAGTLNNVVEKERKFLKQFLSGRQNLRIAARVFTPCELLAPELENLGMLMYRFETDVDNPKILFVGLFFLCSNAFNVSTCVRTALTAMYTNSMVDNVLSMINTCRYVEDKVSLFGVTSLVSCGSSCLLSCVMQGNVYDVNKENIYGLTVLKEILLEPDWEPRQHSTKYVYVVHVYKEVLAKLQYGIYVVLTSFQNEDLVVDILRQYFEKERFLFLNYLINSNTTLSYFGSVQRIGRCATEDIKSGFLQYRGITLSVIKLENIFVDLSEKKVFV